MTVSSSRRVRAARLKHVIIGGTEPGPNRASLDFAGALRLGLEQCRGPAAAEAVVMSYEYYRPLAVRLGKETVNQAFELSLSEGLSAERRAFYSLFSTQDQKEGMRAFLEKRKPVWKGE